MVIVGDVLGELLILLWHLAPLCTMAFVPSSSNLPSFLPSLIFSSNQKICDIAFSHLSLVVSIGVLSPEYPFITFWGYTIHLSLSAHASLEELTVMNFKHHK